MSADDTAAALDRVRAERDALRAAVAHIVRDHNKPPNKDRHGYDYRMGWWDAALYVDKIIRYGVRVCEDCPGDLRAALADTPTAPTARQASDDSCNECAHAIEKHRSPGGCHFDGTSASCRCMFGHGR